MTENTDVLAERAADTDMDGSGAWIECADVALFAPVEPEILATSGEHVPRRIDATAGELAYEDDVDRLVRGIVDGRSEARGLWRSWRYSDPGKLAGGCRAYLVEVAAGTSPATSSALVRTVAQAGDGALVAVFATGADLPPEQRAARACSALLWAARSPGPIWVARVFDSVDVQAGPAFAPDHPRITDAAERECVLEYLRAGGLLVGTPAQMEDVVEPGRGRVVPVNLRTDGSWIWSDAVTYHLARYSLAPDDDLLNHIRGSRMPDVDGAALFRAAMALDNGHRCVLNEEPTP